MLSFGPRKPALMLNISREVDQVIGALQTSYQISRNPNPDTLEGNVNRLKGAQQCRS